MLIFLTHFSLLTPRSFQEILIIQIKYFSLFPKSTKVATHITTGHKVAIKILNKTKNKNQFTEDARKGSSRNPQSSEVLSTPHRSTIRSDRNTNRFFHGHGIRSQWRTVWLHCSKGKSKFFLFFSLFFFFFFVALTRTLHLCLVY